MAVVARCGEKSLSCTRTEGIEVQRGLVCGRRKRGIARVGTAIARVRLGRDPVLYRRKQFAAGEVGMS